MINSPSLELLIFTVYLRPLIPSAAIKITAAEPGQALGLFTPGEGIYYVTLQFERRRRQERRHDRQDDQDDLLGRRCPPEKAVEFTHARRALFPYSGRGGPLSSNIFK